MQTAIIAALAVLAFTAKVHASSPCPPKQHEARRKELQKLFAADQKDRENFEDWTPARARLVDRNDLKRRKRVSEIFAEGCLKTADDFYHAATIFQHGNVHEHYFQTYIWSMEARRLGHPAAGMMAANGIDRYLMSQNRKQLYGTQARTVSSTDFNSCFCLWPIEDSFADDRRRELGVKTGDERTAWLAQINEMRGPCEQTYCESESLRPTPEGSVPGVW